VSTSLHALHAQLEADFARLFVRGEEPASPLPPCDFPADDGEEPDDGDPDESDDDERGYFFRAFTFADDEPGQKPTCSVCGHPRGDAPPPICDACWCRRQSDRSAR
jgi:hypothetical protein